MTFMDNFEEFTPVGGRFTPLISVNETGGIGISTGFIKKYDINKDAIKGVKLYFNKLDNSVGIKFLTEKEPGVVNLKFVERGGASINAKPFWIKFDVEYAKYKNKYIPTVIDSPMGKVFVFTLKPSVNQ